MGELTGLWLTDIRRRYRPEQIGPLVLAAIAESNREVLRCMGFRLEVAWQSAWQSDAGHALDQLDAPGGPEFWPRRFAVTGRSVTVVVDGRGFIVDLAVTDDCAADDEELAHDVLEVADVARAQYRMELRLHSLAAIEAAGGDLAAADTFYRSYQNLPTPEEYQARLARLRERSAAEVL